MAAISYDSEEILRYFADRRKIEFPLLADPDSKIIRAYQVLNPEAVGQFKGMARPGFFFVDAKGVIREKFFEAKYRDRLSGNNVISKLFPELGEEVTSTVEAPHLQLAAEQSDRTGVPGSRITLIAEVRLPRDIHVYAPGTKGYKTVNLVMDCSARTGADTGHLPARENPLYACDTGAGARVRRDISHPAGPESKLRCRVLPNSLGTDGKTFTITGKLAYQACDSKTCFLPTSVPIQWQVHVLPLDRQRSPENIRHK